MKKIHILLSSLFLSACFAACTSEMENDSQVGYLTLGVETNTVAKTRVTNVPAGYAPKQLYVEVTNAAGEIVASTTDWDNDTQLKGQVLRLAPGQYTVTAHSNGWDGSGSGVDAPYYYGTTTVNIHTKVLSTANVICTLANVKVTVKFSPEFQESFASATSTIQSTIAGVGSQTYTMGETKGSSYFPVGDLKAILSVFNKSNEGHSMNTDITGVQARDHYILNYTVAPSGYQGDVTVKVDPTTNTYTYTFEVPRKSGTQLDVYTANAWSTFADLSGKVASKKSDFDQTKLQLQYKIAGADAWTTVDNTALTISGDDISYTVKGLTPATQYTYRMSYITGDDEVYSQESNFTTETQTVLYNGGFELWHYETNNEIAYPTESENVAFWSSSNPGSGSVLKSLAKLTDKTTDYVHGGTYAAKLTSKSTMGILAAASLYTGSFGSLNVASQVASLNWGVPFTSRPTALHGYMIYKPGSVNIAKTQANDGTPLPSDAPASGELDHCQVYCALLNINAPLTVNNGDLSTFPNWQTDPRVIAYGAVTQKTTQDGWVEFTVPFEYHNLTTKPKYILIVASASKYGDYFHGSSSSVLYLDDFELVYGDTPTVKN